MSAEFDPKFIDDVAERLAGRVPGPSDSIRADLKRNFRAMLESAFTQLDLVTREEFEVQRQVLKQTRAKLEALEREITAMEQARDHGTPAAELPPR